MAYRVFKLKRGDAKVWREKNLLLAEGEPGFELDTGKLKIGDGTHKWNDLTYVGCIFNAPDIQHFPKVGSTEVIYKAEKEKKIYQWNS